MNDFLHQPSVSDFGQLGGLIIHYTIKEIFCIY